MSCVNGENLVASALTKYEAVRPSMGDWALLYDDMEALVEAAQG